MHGDWQKMLASTPMRCTPDESDFAIVMGKNGNATTDGQLERDKKFPTTGNVFSVDQIESYLDLKQEEQDRYRMKPHPVEYDMYYSC
jgi:hypothetical protein